MKHLSFAGASVLLAGLVSVVCGAGTSQRQIPSSQNPVQPKAQLQPPLQQPQMINLSLVQALVAIHQEDLAGLFGYIAEPAAAPAFASYLYHSPKSLKLFVQKGEKDLKAAGGVNSWDKEVFLYIVGMSSNEPAGSPVALSAKMLDRVATLSLAQGMSLSEITMRRK